MAWIIRFDPSTEKDFKKIDHSDRKRIFKFLDERVAPLKDPHSIICDIQDNAVIILVVKVGNRKDIYR